MEQWITNYLGTPPSYFKVVGITVNWRGIVTPGAIDTLRTDMPKFNSHLIMLLSVRTLTGGLSTWNAQKSEANA